MGNVSWDARSLGAAARKVAGVVGLLAVAACCRPTPCSPPAFCGTPGGPVPVSPQALPAPVPAEAGGDVEAPGSKFVRIKIINNTQKFIVKKDTTVYSFQYDTNDTSPYCDAVTLVVDRPFRKNVPPNSPLGVFDDPDPDNKYACDPLNAQAFTITLDIVHKDNMAKTKTLTVGCDVSGFVIALITLNQGDDMDDPDKLTATCSCN